MEMEMETENEWIVMSLRPPLNYISLVVLYSREAEHLSPSEPNAIGGSEGEDQITPPL